MHYTCIVFGANLCVPRPLEVNDKGFRGVGGVTDENEYNVHTEKLLPGGSTSYLAVSVSVPLMSLVCIICAFVFILPAIE